MSPGAIQQGLNELPSEGGGELAKTLREALEIAQKGPQVDSLGPREQARLRVPLHPEEGYNLEAKLMDAQREIVALSDLLAYQAKLFHVNRIRFRGIYGVKGAWVDPEGPLVFDALQEMAISWGTNPERQTTGELAQELANRIKAREIWRGLSKQEGPNHERDYQQRPGGNDSQGPK